MKFLKVVLMVLVGLLVVILVTGLFVNSKFDVEREVDIQSPKDSVFAYLKMLKNQDDFSVWAQMDPNMRKTFRGQDGTVGFISAWDSQHKDVGKGEQEIIAIEDGSRIDYELRFLKPFETTNQAYMLTNSIDDSTTEVVWGFKGGMEYPMNIMLLFMDMETMLGNDLQNGLNNLKTLIETQ